MAPKALRASEDGGELSPAVAELLEDYAQGEAPSDRLRHRMLRELNHSVGSGVEPLFPIDDVDPPRAASAGGGRAVWTVAALALAAGVAALVWSGYDANAVVAEDAPPNAAQDVVEHEPQTHDATTRSPSPSKRTAPAEATTTPPPDEPQDEPPAAAPEPEPAPSTRTRGAKRSATDAEPSQPRPSSRLDEEAASLAAARRTLNAGNHAAALSQLRSHEKRFQHGLLTQEREVLFVQALCKAGKHAAAKKRAARFEKRFPSSPHMATVAEACED